MPQKVEKILLGIIKVGTVLILFLPLLVYRQVFYPFVFPKIIVFRILAEIIFFAWLFLVLYAKNRENYKVNFKNPLIIALTSFVGVLFLASVFGIDFSRSFWSTQERMTGLLTHFHFFTWFVVLISCFSAQNNQESKEKNRKDWIIFIWMSLSCSVLVGFYGLGQRIGLGFLLKDGDISRISSTLGNPIFLGVYSMLHIFLAGFLIFIQKKKLLKFISIAVGIFNLVIMALTASRTVIIAFLIAVLLFAIFLFLKSSSRKAKLIIGPIAGLVILAVLGGLIFLQIEKRIPGISNTPVFISRISNLTTSLEQRTMAWQAGWSGFLDRPILGWGWENFNAIFDKYYQPSYLTHGLDGTWFDHSHNQVVDVLSLSGIIGLISFLGLFVIIFWLLIKKIKILTLKQGIPLSILGLMFLAYFLQNLTVFDTPAPLIVFYFSLALVYTITNLRIYTNDINNKNFANSEKSINPNFRSPNPNYPATRFPLPVLIFLIVVFGGWGMYKFNLEPLQQSKLGMNGYRVADLDFKSSVDWYQQALAKNSFINQGVRIYLDKELAKKYSEISDKTNQSDADFLAQATEFALEEGNKTVQEHPRNARHWLYLGQLYNLAVNYNSEYVGAAKSALDKALELSPKRQQIYFELARLDVFQKDYKSALDRLYQSWDLDRSVSESKNKLKAVAELAAKEQDQEVVDKAKEILEEVNRSSE